MKKSSLRVSAM